MKVIKKYQLLLATLAASYPQILLAADPKLITYKGTSISSFLKIIRTWFLGFAGALAILFIIIGGVKYITAAGNDKKEGDAKTTLTYAIIGLLLVLLSNVILSLIAGGLIGSVFGDSNMPYN